MDRSAPPPPRSPGDPPPDDSTIPVTPGGPPSPDVPSHWGRLEKLELIGSGRFGWIFRAWEPSLQRHVALKLEKGPGTDLDAAGISQSLAEGRRLARVRHPNLVSVYGAERHGGRAGIWMELVEGRTLKQIVEDSGPLGDREAVNVVADVCRALCDLHRNQIIHRDVSANNVMRETGGRIVLMDLGLGTDSLDDSETGNRVVVGTPGFIAPEVFEGQPATAVSDVYSAGVLLFYLLTGSFPVAGKSVEDIVRAHREGRSRLIHELRPDLPPVFAEIFDHALARDPAHRFPSAAALETALAHAIGSNSEPASSGDRTTTVTLPQQRSKASKLLFYGGAVAIVAVLAFVVWGDRFRALSTSPARAYRIAANFYRNDTGEPRLLQDGDDIAPGDAINLEMTISDTLFVYVVNRDEESNTYLLFPSEGFSPNNPLPPGKHRLPGYARGERVDWQITTAGGAESYWVIVSRTRPLDLELELFALPQPAMNDPAVVEGEQYAGTRRATGALTRSRVEQVGARLQEILDAAPTLPAREETASGLWSGRLVLDNPRSAP